MLSGGFLLTGHPPFFMENAEGFWPGEVFADWPIPRVSKGSLWPSAFGLAPYLCVNYAQSIYLFITHRMALCAP